MKKILMFMLILLGMVGFVNADADYYYDIANATYSGLSLSVSAQDTITSDLMFNNNQSKLYMIGYSSDRIYEYDCTTPGKIDTCTYSTRFLSILAQDGSATGIEFNNNESKVYVSGSASGKIYEYDCTTPGKIDTCTYSTRFLTISGQDSSVQDIEFNNNESKFYISGGTNDRIYEYDCTTPGKIDTCTYSTRNLLVTSQDTFNTGISFSSNESNFYMTGYSNDRIYEYHCTTPGKIDTCTYSTRFLTISGQDGLPMGITFDNVGTKIYLIGRTNNAIFEYNINFTAPVPIINSDIQEYYNSSNISINLNTSDNVNMSYILDSGIETNICNNCNLATLNLTGLNESLHNIIFISIDENGQSNISNNFTIDTTAPVINNNISSKTDSYLILFNGSTCTDTNIDTCSISINSQTKDLFVDTNITSTLNGNISYTITATDLAGNSISENGIVFVNPLFYVYFEDEDSILISNFSVNGTDYINIFSENIYDYGLGTHNFLFEKLGFNTSTFQLTFNTTSNINTTFQVPGAKIEISIYDITDYTLINDSNTTIEIIGNSFSQIYTTSTGLLNISSLLMEEETYSVIMSNSFYETTSFSFNFNNQEVIEVAGYMTPLELNDSLIADIVIKVVDDYSQPIRNNPISVIQYVWDSGQSKYVQSNLKVTDYNGETSFKVFLNTKRYNFCAVYQNVQYCETDLFININTQEVVIEIPINELAIVEEDPIYDIDFSYTLTNTTINISGTLYTSVTFSYNNPNQDVDEYCLKIYEIEKLQRTLVANQCDISHTAGLSINVIENRTKNYVAVATIELDDSIRTLDPELYLYKTFDIQEELDGFGWVKIIILVVISFVIGIAIHKKVHNIIIAHLGLPVVFLIFSLAFPDYITFDSFVLVLLANLFAYKIVTQKDDIKKDAGFTTLNSIIILYIVFVFGLFVGLSEMNDKGYLDETGEAILLQITDDNSYFNNYLDTSIENLKTKKADANTGAWEQLTGIFLKTLEFVDTFFSILSNLFNVATTMGLIIGIKNSLLLSFIKLIDYGIVGYVSYLYFKEAFK